MLITLLLFLLSAVTIYLACEYFVNGIEWTGHHLKFSQSATGSLLAALGTALPECIVTLTALLMGDAPAQQQIGIGAALGGPLVLSTIGYAAVGLTLLLCMGSEHRAIDSKVQRETGRDQAWFVAIFLVAVALGMMAFTGKTWLAPLFVLVYLVYVRRELKQTDSHETPLPEPLKLDPKAGIPALRKVLLQTLGALVVVALAAQLFVHQLESMGELLGLSPVLAALLLSPVATEMPELMNVLIWVRQGKNRLALANISGAMMIQGTIPKAFCLLFTPWLLDSTMMVSSLVTLLAVMLLWWGFSRGRMTAGRLACIGVVYLGFCGWLMVS
ncbi:sodium:calcium antiporter [Aeromonas media]|uniref:sodium:calcium antiporter n=1 Tax=Aeromonas media TaxID=651 RepID=UPI00143D2E99|nr:sodium:calcium antiporter [Aeromonas media]QIY87729.1 sodium:calcium antiporter [Aeromonas hydrophila]